MELAQQALSTGYFFGSKILAKRPVDCICKDRIHINSLFLVGFIMKDLDSKIMLNFELNSNIRGDSFNIFQNAKK